MKTINLLMLSLFLAVVAPLCARAGSEIVRDPNAWDFAPLLYYDRVVCGKVTSASITEIGAADLTMDPPELRAKAGNPPITVVRVSMNVSEVLRGTQELGEQSFLVVGNVGEALDIYKSGAELLTCLKYHPLLKVYCQTSSYGIYMKDGSAWTSKVTARGQRTFSDRDIRTRISSVDLENVASAAELIIKGKVQAVATSEVTGPDGSTAEMLTIQLNVQSVEKGSFSDDVIEVKALVSGMYLPAWRKHVPTSFAKGQQWLCFLQRNEVGWYPFAGTNGMLEIVEGKYIYDNRVPFWHSPEKVSASITQAQGERR